MARHFSPITQEELRAKVEAAWEKMGGKDTYAYRSLTPAVEKDLQKVKFDTENVFDAPEEEGIYSPLKELMGYHTLYNGLSFLGVLAGGDWEWPIFFIIYWDGRQLRAYIPVKGNPWNSRTYQAYGNAYPESEDWKDFEKRFKDLADAYKLKYPNWDGGYMEADIWEWESRPILEDIQERLQAHATK